MVKYILFRMDKKNFYFYCFRNEKIFFFRLIDIVLRRIIKVLFGKLNMVLRILLINFDNCFFF